MTYLVNRALRSCALAAGFLWSLSACSPPEQGMEPEPPDEAPSFSLTASALSFSTGTFTVPPGDSFECFYTPIITDRELNIHNGYGHQGPGGHHITVYYTTVNKQAPGHHPCTDDEMVTWRMVAGVNDGGTAGGEGLVELPPGVVMKVPAGAQIVTQSHYINATSQPRKLSDSATVNIVPTDQVKAYANYMVANDATFAIPAQGSRRRSMTCVTPQDLKLVLYLGHMHERGRYYKLERIDDKGNQLELMYEYEWEPAFTSHPPVRHFPMEQPKLLPKGTLLRQTCSWLNNTDEVLRFPREMCLAFMYYFPDQGELDCEVQEAIDVP